jgi:hypothetical protein
MTDEILYLNDNSGTITAVQIPINKWEDLLNEINRYKQMFNLKNDLTDAFKHVELMRSGKIQKQSMDDFLNEL